jgi:Fic-DOC domain mobile mystery protein B
VSDPEGTTPLDPDEAGELIPSHITTREELNGWEQQNILGGQRWALSQKRPRVLSIAFARELHRQMFDKTWRWAGDLRNTDKNVGIPWHDLSTSLADLFRDTAHWLERGTYTTDEAAARFHHRLTWIHPFPNGNGRFARLMTEILLLTHDRPPFVWGRDDLDHKGDVRSRYIAALRAADKGDFTLLFAFLDLEHRP